MEEYVVKILNIENVTHNVKRFQFEKPVGYSFIPGQATDVSINIPSLKNEKRPFTFTSLNSAGYLEFTIKIYTDHNGITNELGKLEPGSELIIRDVWGDIAYKQRGVFIAGGAGITPFISIFRDLQSKRKIGGNTLIFSNKTKKDIILESELKLMLGNSFINILSEEKSEGYAYGFITEEFLKANIPENPQNYYLCGPPPMMEVVIKQLSGLGVNEKSITMEKM
jgi:Flavodoxin reductases (ferredoxin-NADPH reductases) family 1